MNRRRLMLALTAAAASAYRAFDMLPADAAGLGFAWGGVPAITVLAAEADPRLPLVRDAVDYWNGNLAALGSGFRLGPVTQTIGTIPASELAAVSERVLNHGGTPPPDGLRGVPGDIVVALSEGNFVSFSFHWATFDRALVAIKSEAAYPMTLPNVPRNVIAHELGHAIGLGHNSDPTTLMCGRPAPCRPDAFQSASEHYFPLTNDEKALLLRLYPADWHPR
jgi:hypothetical protein